MKLLGEGQKFQGVRSFDMYAPNGAQKNLEKTAHFSIYK